MRIASSMTTTIRRLDTIAESPGLRRDTVVALTTDHGGNGPSLSDVHKLDNYRVPFTAQGAGIEPCLDHYDLNLSPQDSDDARSTHSGPQPIRNGDPAIVAIGLLGPSKVPESQFDADQRLPVKD